MCNGTQKIADDTFWTTDVNNFNDLYNADDDSVLIQSVQKKEKEMHDEYHKTIGHPDNQVLCRIYIHTMYIYIISVF